LSFSAWRQQVRLMAALPRLARGEPVTAVALDLGYEAPGSFTEVFRRWFGTTPSGYFGEV
jgi:AraC-like DNA-binding protein